MDFIDGEARDQSDGDSSDAFNEISQVKPPVRPMSNSPVERSSSSDSSDEERETSLFEDAPNWGKMQDSNELSFLTKHIAGVKGVRETDAAKKTSEITSLASKTKEATIEVKVEKIKKQRKRAADTDNPKGEKKPKKQKKDRDPNHPKQPKNPYLYFAEKMRSEISRENPTVGGRDLNKLIGQKWKEMTEEHKILYNHMAESDKVRYYKEMEVYNALPQKNPPVQAKQASPSVATDPANLIINSAQNSLPNSNHNSTGTPSVSKYFQQLVKVQETEAQKKKRKKIIVKVKKEGQDYFERFMLKQRTLAELLEKIAGKYPEDGSVNYIINIPDVVITDDEGIRCLKDDSELVVSFK